MRALSIAMFIFLLSLSISAFREAYGLSPGSMPFNVDKSDVEAATSMKYDPLYMVVQLPMLFEKLWKVILGAALLGDTVAGLLPFPPPSSLVTGLNLLGTVSLLLAAVQFFRGLAFRMLS